MKLFRVLLAFALALLPLSDALAASGYTTIAVVDQGGTTRQIVVLSSTGAITGNLNWANVVCDQSAGTTCASVGTAGSPSTNALTVQQVTLGNGTSAAAPRFTLSNDSTGVLATVSTVTTVGTVTTLSTLTGGGVASGSADSGNPVKTGGKYNASPITLTDGNRGDLQLDVNGYTKVNVTNANANGQATMANSSPVVLPSNMGDPCAFAAKTNVAISMQNTTTVKLVSLASSQKIYICSLSLIASGATVFSIVDGTKVSTECDTAAEAVMGTTTASHGLSLAANGGITFGNGEGTVALTNTAAHDLCLFQSGSVDLSGNMTYVQRVP